MIDGAIVQENPSSIALRSDSPVARDERGFYIKVHPEFIESARFVLKSATVLIEAQSAKMILFSQNHRTKVIRYRSHPVNPLEKKIIARCVREKKTFSIQKNQMVYDSYGETIGRAENSYLLAPILAEANIILGAIVLENKNENNHFAHADETLTTAFCRTFGRLTYSSVFDTGNRPLMVHFASNLYTLLENLYLYRSNLETNFLLSEVIKVSKMINSTLDLESLLESIMDSAKVVLKAEGASLMLIDPKTNELFFNIIAGEKERALKEIRIPMGVGIAGLVAQNRKAEIVNDAQNDPRLFKGADEKIGFVTKNLIATPLMVRNKVIGVIEVINSIGRNEFSEKDLELFNTFSEQSALAIHNRELIDSLKEINRELKKKVHELSSLHEISKALISTLNEKDLYDSVVRIICEELEAQRVSILIFNSKTERLEVISQEGLGIEPFESNSISVSDTLAGQAFEKNQLIFSNQLEDSPYAEYYNPDRYYTGFCIVQPLSMGDQKYGVINISEKKSPSGFSEDDLKLVNTISAQITRAIQNFRLLEEMIEKKSYEKELEITSAIQKSILPSKKIGNRYFDMGIMSEPAKVMGGDFFDFFRSSEEEYSFIIADVSGKSLPAALFMAVTSSIIRTLGADNPTPSELLYKANDHIYKASQSGMFVTTFYAVYNVADHKLEFSSAGHNEQMVLRHSSQEIEYLSAHGRPLGVIDSTLHGKFGQAQTYLRSGDLLILYTDGVTEAINSNNEEFGLPRFQKVIQDNYLLSADQIVKRIYRAVQDFTGDKPLYDDFTLMVIKAL